MLALRGRERSALILSSDAVGAALGPARRVAHRSVLGWAGSCFRLALASLSSHSAPLPIAGGRLAPAVANTRTAC